MLGRNLNLVQLSFAVLFPLLFMGATCTVGFDKLEYFIPSGLGDLALKRTSQTTRGKFNTVVFRKSLANIKSINYFLRGRK